MPEGRFRSRTFRRVQKRTPNNGTVLRYERRNPSKAVCSSCKSPLSGVPRKIPSELKKLPKNQKRPDRPFGGVLCSKCLKNKIKQEARD